MAERPAPAPSKTPTVLIVLIVLVPIFLFIVGVVASLAIFGVSKYLLNAKTAEARNHLGQLALHSVKAFQRRGGKFCRDASVPVPTRVQRAAKYQSAPGDWTADGPDAGFACLGFSLSTPQYYQYDYRTTGDGSTAGDTVLITAKGDLDGDGVESTFTLRGTVEASGALTFEPTLVEIDPEE